MDPKRLCSDPDPDFGSHVHSDPDPDLAPDPNRIRINSDLDPDQFGSGSYLNFSNFLEIKV